MGKDKKKSTMRTSAACGAKWKFISYLERGHHLALFLTVNETIVVLHRNERREAIIDRVICLGKKEDDEWPDEQISN